MNCFSVLSRAVLASLMVLSSSIALAEVLAKDEVVLGITLPLTGPVGEFGKAALDGAQLYFDQVNSRGGVHGRMIRVVAHDDGYSTAKGVANVDQLLEKDNAFLLFGVLGTETNLAILPTLEKQGVPSVGPGTGSSALRDPGHRLVFHIRAGFEEEVRKIVDHLRVRGITQVTAVYQNNPFGKEALGYLKKAAANGGVRMGATVSIENDASDVGQAVRVAAEAKSPAIITLTIGRPSVAFVKALRGAGQSSLVVMLSPMGSQQTVKALGADGVGVIVSQVVPFPFSPATAIAREYQRASNDARNLSFIGMEAFILAKVTTEGLQRAGRHLTREGFVRAMESMKDYDLGGYVISFGKAKRNGTSHVELTAISQDGRFIR